MIEVVIEQEIISHLREHYKEKDNHNFYFKSSNLPLDYNSRLIGRVLKNKVWPHGVIDMWSKGEATHIITWVTCFNGGNNENVY